MGWGKTSEFVPRTWRNAKEQKVIKKPRSSNRGGFISVAKRTHKRKEKLEPMGISGWRPKGEGTLKGHDILLRGETQTGNRTGKSNL